MSTKRTVGSIAWGALVWAALAAGAASALVNTTHQIGGSMGLALLILILKNLTHCFLISR